MPVYLPGLAFGVGYGGAPYGTSPYGSGALPRLPVPPTGGYGGAPYGYSSYGSLDVIPPKVTGARSIDGYRIEVFFSEALRDEPALYDTANYTLTAILGKLPGLISITPLTPGAHGGWTSVLIIHDGTTLGGSHTISVSGVHDLVGNLILPTTTGFLALGDEASMAVGLPSPDPGNQIDLQFTNSYGDPQDILTEAAFSPGVEDLSSYEIASPSYPVLPVLSNPQQDPAQLSKVTLECTPMTSAVYDLTAGPSLSLEYTGAVLPDDDPSFNGVEVGSGSSASSAVGLFLSKDLADTYGWAFLDSTGRVLPNTTYRFDCAIDVTGTTLAPGSGDIAQFVVNDGVIEVIVTFVSTAGITSLRVDSGMPLSLTAPAEWADGNAHSISLIRNQQAGLYSLLFDGVPLLTWALGIPAGVPSLTGAGAGFFLSPGNKVSLFNLKEVRVSSSQTLFTSAWNFIHGLTTPFTGSAVLTRDRILTKYGPLVRGWGDATPATKEDVSVRLDGGEIDLQGVNPYVGEIYPLVPIPLFPPPEKAAGDIEVGPLQPAVGVCQITVNSVTLQEGVDWVNGATVADTAAAIAAAIVVSCGCDANAFGSTIIVTALTEGTSGNLIDLSNTSGDPNIAVSGAFLTGGVDGVEVEVDYIWFPNPAMSMVGLNTRGLTLNVWDRAVGHTPGAMAPFPASATGSTKDNRFPMGIVLNGYTRPSPKQVAHRYIGFQKNGYSALLNEPTTLRLNQNPHAISVGSVSAESMESQATFDGSAAPDAVETPWELSGVDSGGWVGEGLYRVVDASSGPYGVGTAAIWQRRLAGEEDLSTSSSYTASARFSLESWGEDGVFTGAGFGVHNGNRLILVGCLLIDGVQHVGILTDAEKPHLESSWLVGPSATAEAESTSVIVIPYDELPHGVDSATRFRVSSGPQKGVYKVAECGAILRDDGNVELTLTEELPVDPGVFGAKEFTVFFETPWSEDLVSLRFQAHFPTGYFEAYLGGAVSGFVGSLDSAIPYPAQTSLLLPAIEDGVAFWGSLSRRATSSSLWDLTQYYNFPAKALKTAQGLAVLTEMEVVPEEATQPWYVVGDFGTAEALPSEQLLLKSTSAPVSGDVPQLTFSYERVEPFYNPQVSMDFEAQITVDHCRLGSQNIDIALRDGRREVCFTPLWYLQDANGRELIEDLSQSSLSGLQSPDSVGWSGSSDISLMVRGQVFELEKSASQTGYWTKTLDLPSVISTEGLILETRVAILSETAGTVGNGFLSGVAVRRTNSDTRVVYLSLVGGQILLVDAAENLIASYPYAYDNAFHNYKLTADPVANIVILSVDGVVLGNVPLTDFITVGGRPEAAFFGALGTGEFKGVVDSTFVVPLRAVAPSGAILGRTFGILLRDGDPKSIDGYKIPRADGTHALNSSSTAVPVQMDWTNPCHIRLYVDPTWGVSFYRPDLPPPPWATGDYATQTTDPTNAWAWVETRNLPLRDAPRGSVSWGSSQPQAITQSQWDFVRYRLRGDVDGFGIAPQNMVLNRAFTFTSDEFLNDLTPETKTIKSRSPTLVVLSDSAVYADRVFIVQVDGVVVPSSDWAFNPSGQVLALSTPLPSSAYPVTVSFAASRPVTKTYLCDQPLETSGTILNEGTPPFVSHLDAPATRAVVPGTPITPPPPADGYELVEFEDGPDSLYASLEFCTKEDGDSVHISPMCDTAAPGHGLAEIGLEGLFTSDAFSNPEGPGGVWGSASPVIKGSSSRFPQISVLLASGGNYEDGVLGPGTAILYPNGRGPEWEVLEGPGPTMGMNQDFRLILEDISPREESLEGLLGDNIPPSSAVPVDPNPDGVGSLSGLGTAAYRMEDYSNSPFSRLGPWTGLFYLDVRSLLAGGAQLTGDQFVLNGGAQLPIVRTITDGVIEHP